MMIKTKPIFLSATEAVREIKAGRLAAVDVLESCIEQIERLDAKLMAWEHLAYDKARLAAAEIDRAIKSGKEVGALAGIPVGVKDIFNTYDMPTAMGSPIWAGFTPGNDARVVSSLRLAGAVIPGKTVTAEFAVHTPGKTVNPHNSKHTPGTSSSGSAAAVAAYMTPLALGTQTAGSTIRPASYCGIYGFKPSFGLLPRTGSLKTTDSLDTIGFFARTVEDLRLMFDVLRVQGPDYPFSHAALNDSSRRKPDDRPWRIALVRGPKWNHAETYAQKAILDFAEALRKQKDFVIEEASLPPGFDEAHDVHAAIYDKTLSYYFQEEFKKETLVSPILKALIVHGQQIGLDHYRAALSNQTKLAAALDRWLEQKHDILLTLSTGGEALPGLDSVDRPDTCLIWTLCGAPAITLPVFVGPLKMPFGAQIVARRYNDFQLLEFADSLRRLELIPSRTNPKPALS